MFRRLIDWIWPPAQQRRAFTIVDNQINHRNGIAAERPETTTLAINKLKELEGFRPSPYLCPANVWTIGYGSTRDESGLPIGPDCHPVTELQALAMMLNTLDTMEHEIRCMVSVPLSNNQFSAIVLFTYNFGCHALRTSTLLKKLNSGDYIGAAGEFKRWRYISHTEFVEGEERKTMKVSEGLVKRRAFEVNMFKTKDIIKD